MKLHRLKLPVSCIVEELKNANFLVAGFSFPDMITLKNLELAYKTVNDNANALRVRQLIGETKV